MMSDENADDCPKNCGGNIERQSEWRDRNIETPQADFEVIACCDDDVKMCVYRQTCCTDSFELPSGKVFEATHWMPKPEPAL